MAEFGQQSNFVTSPSVLVDQEWLIHVGDVLIVSGLVVLLIARGSAILVKGGGWTLSEVDSVNLVRLLVVPGDHSRTCESLLNCFLTIETSLFGLVSQLTHVVETIVSSYNFEADVNVEKDSCLFHDQSRVKTWPDLDVVSVQTVSIRLVETLLADCLELETAHHGVEKDLQEVHVILVSLLHNLHPFNCDFVIRPIMLRCVDRKLGNFLEGEHAQAIVNVELETLLNLVSALLENFFAHGTRVVRNLGFKLDRVLVDSSHIFAVEFNLEEVGVES